MCWGRCQSTVLTVTVDTAPLLYLATQFRSQIEAVPLELRPEAMRAFPMGCCGDASLLLGTFLIDQGIVGFDYVCGERGDRSQNTWVSHAWLQSREFIIDITADQFSDAPSAIIVMVPSTWHTTFDVKPSKPGDFRHWRGYGAEMLAPMYERIKAKIAQETASTR